jgi:hypothetical protein
MSELQQEQATVSIPKKNQQLIVTQNYTKNH